jgi:hypothetical protein
MRNFIIQYDLTENFWDQYDSLWQNSKDRSPFQAPSVLKYFSLIEAGSMGCLLFDNKTLLGAVMLKKEKKHLNFLSDRKSDANWFVFHRNCTDEDINYFFSSLLNQIRLSNWSLILNKVKSWNNNMQGFDEAGRKSDLFWLNLKYSVCPALEAENPDLLFSIINRSRQFRYAVNRIRKQFEGVFEVFNDDTDLEAWVNDFCQCHVKRWDKTSTPSSFRDLNNRKFLFQCLQAWHEDDTLVRFSVKANGKRIGFSVNLKEKQTLIGHSTTFDPEYSKLSPGKSLIYIMAEWIRENNYTVFDFGNGDEEYKYSLANKDQHLQRIFISSRTNFPFIIMAKAIKFVRQERRLYLLYKNKFKIILSKVRKIKNQDKLNEYKVEYNV